MKAKRFLADGSGQLDIGEIIMLFVGIILFSILLANVFPTFLGTIINVSSDTSGPAAWPAGIRATFDMVPYLLIFTVIGVPVALMIKLYNSR